MVEANAAHTEEMITYSSMIRRKYEEAARYPWLAVAADRDALLVGSNRCATG